MPGSSTYYDSSADGSAAVDGLEFVTDWGEVIVDECGELFDAFESFETFGGCLADQHADGGSPGVCVVVEFGHPFRNGTLVRPSRPNDAASPGSSSMRHLPELVDRPCLVGDLSVSFVDQQPDGFKVGLVTPQRSVSACVTARAMAMASPGSVLPAPSIRRVRAVIRVGTSTTVNVLMGGQ